MRVAALLFMLFLFPGLLSGQDIVRRDAASGDYFVTVYDDDLSTVELRVVPTDKVRLTVRPRVETFSGNARRYLYTARVSDDSPQALAYFRVHCPAPSDRFGEFDGTPVPDGDAGPWVAWHVPYDGRSFCSFEGPTIPLRAGGRLEASLSTELLPVPGTVRAIGFREGIRWPTHDPIPQNDRARMVIDSLQDAHGWIAVSTIVPARDPSAFDSPANAIGLIRIDLAQACVQLGWITNPGVCRSLEAKLEEAARSLRRGRTDAAREQLESFLAELDAEHGAPPGKHVNDNAYALLRTNAEYLLSRL